MQIETEHALHHLEVYVLREFEAEKKLTAKDPNSYGLGPKRIIQLDVTQANGPGKCNSPSLLCHLNVKFYI